MRKAITALALALPMSIGCTTEHQAGSEAGSGPTSDVAPKAAFRVATYNAGLAPLDVEYAVERAPRVVEALGTAASELDALCVQEFWLPENYSDLEQRVRGNLPHSIRLAPRPGDTTCSPGEIGPLEKCVIANCPGEAGSSLADCALQHCPDDFDVSASCANCLLSQSSSGADITGIEKNCLGTSDAGGSDAALYGGVYDTGLLTRSEPVEQDSLDLDAYLVRAAVHYARVPTDHGDVNVFCTHLASSIPPFAYRGKHGDWVLEQADQIDQLVEFLKRKTEDQAQVVVLGDLNTGPAVNGLESELPDLYAKFAAAGFADPYVATGSPECTLCPDNTIRGAGSAPKLDDHILTRGFTQAPLVERFLTTTTSIEPSASTADAGAPKAPVVTSLSDHYGLRATFGR